MSETNNSIPKCKYCGKDAIHYVEALDTIIPIRRRDCCPKATEYYRIKLESLKFTAKIMTPVGSFLDDIQSLSRTHKDNPTAV